ncbi:MAG: response regulator transcription factor [Bacteroidota bacterium]
MERVIQLGLIDDQNLFREGMKLVLNTFPELNVLLEATSGPHLLEQLKEVQPDVLLLDYTMPEMDGYEVLKAVNASYPTVKVIMLSMHFDESLMAYLMQNGANGYLLKDEQSNTVKEAIVTVMKAGQYFPDYVSKALLKQLQIQAPTNVKKSPRLKKDSFSTREKEILNLIGKYSRQEMANQLFISIKTIDFHLKNLRDKTESTSTAELVRYAIKYGFQE